MTWSGRYLLVEGLSEEQKGAAELAAASQEDAALEAHERAMDYAGANAFDLYHEGRQITRLWTASS